MVSSSRTNRFRRFFLYGILVASLCGCTFRHTDVFDPGLLARKKVVFIYGIEDNLKIKETLRNEMMRWGYIMTEDKSKAELTVDFNYQCYWDVFHYTCKRFNFYIADAASGKVLVHSQFSANTPFGVEEQVKNLLENVDDRFNKLRDNGTLQNRKE